MSWTLGWDNSDYFFRLSCSTPGAHHNSESGEKKHESAMNPTLPPLERLTVRALPDDVVGKVLEQLIEGTPPEDLCGRLYERCLLLLGSGGCPPIHLIWQQACERFGLRHMWEADWQSTFRRLCREVKFLRDAGPGVLDGTFVTRLHSACRFNQRLLLEACLGTHPDISSMTFKRPPRKHVLTSSVLISDIILDHACDPFALSIVERLLQEPTVDVNQKDLENDEMPLGCAAMRGKVPMIILLLEHGADVNARNRCDATPLRLAVNSRHSDAARLLREWGAGW